MDIREFQEQLRIAQHQMENPFRSGAEILSTMTEELGEVATEVALLERIGSKAHWQKEPSLDRLSTEILHLLNVTLTLANHFGIDMDNAITNTITDT